MKKRPIIITTTNAITIPKKVRNLLDLQPGDCLDYEVMANGSIILVRKECCDSPSLRPTCKLPCQTQKRKQPDWLEEGFTESLPPALEQRENDRF